MIDTLHVALNLQQKKVVCVGGGKVATRKLTQLLSTGAEIIVIAPEILPEILEMEAIKRKHRSYKTGDLVDAHLVYICTDDIHVNEQILKDIEAFQWVNNCSNRQDSTFYSESLVQFDDITVAISSNASSPAKTKLFRQKLEKLKQRILL